MLQFPNAKINIGLFITEKRTDGYHNLETVFYPIKRNDALEILPSKNPEGNMFCSGLPVTGNTQDNLVWKAWKLLHNNFPNQVSAFDVYLHKNIPMGAGLGGGSSDAAFLLKMVNDYCALQLSPKQLAEYALKLGSDCPFFIENTPAFASGRGEQLQPITLDLSDYRIYIVCPSITVSTAQAFSQVSPQKADFDLRTIGQLPLNEWRNQVHNDFEASVFARYPTLAAIKELLYRQGAHYASMSGSGSVLYGIFPKTAELKLEGNFSVFEV